MFENKIYENIYYSRFIASFAKSGGDISKRWKFKEWLESLIINGKPIPEDVISEIVELATNGKLELEVNAKHFLKTE